MKERWKAAIGFTVCVGLGIVYAWTDLPREHTHETPPPAPSVALQCEQTDERLRACRESLDVCEATRERCYMVDLDECRGHLRELIGHKCDACEMAWYRAKSSYEPKAMDGPGRIMCPSDMPVVWVDPDYSIGGDWAYICTPSPADVMMKGARENERQGQR